MLGTFAAAFAVQLQPAAACMQPGLTAVLQLLIFSQEFLPAIWQYLTTASMPSCSLTEVLINTK
jgi:hypothetical protein